MKLNAVDYGVPQKRERAFIVGNIIEAGMISLDSYKQPKISVQEAIDDLVGFEHTVHNHEPMKHSPRIIARFAATEPGESTRDAMDRDPSLGDAKITKQCYRRLIANKPAPTLVANFVTTTIHYSQHRNITAREGARIQSFPDDFVFHGLKTRMSWQKGLSQFEQIGNSVPPKLAFCLAKEVRLMFEGKRRAKKSSKSKKDRIDNDLDVQYAKVMQKIQNTSNNKGRRGRKSKYQKYYNYLENCSIGDSIEIPEYLGRNPQFIEAAMFRRNIKITLVEDSGNFQAVKVA